MNSFLSVPIVGVVHFNAMVCDWICFLDSIVLGSIADNTNVFCASGNTISNDINHDSIARRMPNDHNSYTPSGFPYSHCLQCLQLPQLYQPPLPSLIVIEEQEQER